MHAFQGSLLYNMPAFVIAGVLFVGMVTLALLTYRIGLRRPREKRGDIGSIETAVAGFVGLLLAFSYSMAQGRFDERQRIITAEADAVGAAFLKCSVLDSPDREACQADLTKYAALRVEFGDLARDPVRHPEIVRESEEVQGHVLAIASGAVQKAPTPPHSLLLGSLTDVVDRHVDRVAINREIVPPVVTVLILLVCLAWTCFLGYVSGTRNNRHPVAYVLLSLVVSMVVFVMLEFDRPHRGVITVERAEESLHDLSRMLNQKAPPFYPAKRDEQTWSAPPGAVESLDPSRVSQ
jgi:hypothetical protein